MSRLRNLTAIILNKREFMENDLILTVLDEQGERLELIAKGAGKGKSERRRHLERMNLIQGTLYEGRTHHYLQDVSCQSSHSQLKDSLELIMEASILLELTERSVMLDDPHPEVFELLRSTLTEMNKKDAQRHVLDMSLVQLAHHLGFLPNFRACSQCHAESKKDLHWDRDHGTLHCGECGPGRRPLEIKYRKAMEFFRLTHVSRAQHLRLQPEEQNTLRALIFQLFEAHLQAPLKTLSSAL